MTFYAIFFCIVFSFSSLLGHHLKNDPFLSWLQGCFSDSPETQLHYFSKAIQQDKDYGLAYRGRGWAKEHLLDFSGAIQDFKTALSLNPNDPVSWYGLAKAKESNGDLDGALTDVSKALTIRPDYLWAFALRGELWEKKGNPRRSIKDKVFYERLKKDDAKALRLLDQHLLLHPANYQAFEFRGNIKADRGDFSGAIADYNEVLIRFPKYSRAYLKRAQFKKKEGHFEEAIQDLNTALSLDSKFKEASLFRSEMLSSQKNEEQT